MQNYIQEGRILNLGLPANTLPGAVVIVGEIIGIAVAGGSDGTNAAVAVQGVYELPKNSSDTFGAGAYVYWDSTNGYATVTATNNKLLGVSTAIYGSGTTSANIRLNGSF